MAAGCGARSSVVTRDPDGAPVAVALYVPDGAGCVEDRAASEAADVLAPEAGDAIAVTDIAFAEECTGAGGQYVMAQEIDGFRYFWLGGHACYFVDQISSSAGLVFGVVRYAQTAGLLDVPADVCVGWPGEPPGLQTDAMTKAIAVFETLEEARAFAEAL
jgi:hypothetical protein